MDCPSEVTLTDEGGRINDMRKSDRRIMVELLLLKLRQSPPAEEVAKKAAKYDSLNTPEIHDFILAVEREALHQRERWQHDASKTDADWFWLVGYLAGKALHKPEKRLHHIITTAAACLNWHRAALSAKEADRG